MPNETDPFFSQLKQLPRLLLQARLKPIQGDRFQPTGFPDLGAAVYRRPTGERMLLVESAQSVANRLEATILEGGRGPKVIPDLDGLPYILVNLTGATTGMTSSLVEAHRINSPFIVGDEAFSKKFEEMADYDETKPVNWQALAKAIFRFDPNSLLHGVFMANIGNGRMRIPRAVSGFIEAEGVEEAASGGVKNSYMDPKGVIRHPNISEDVYGNVPFHRVEFVAKSIHAYFNLDISLIRSFQLGEPAERLLTALALYKIQKFLNESLRLRSMCDLAVEGGLTSKSQHVSTESIPSVDALKQVVIGELVKCEQAKLISPRAERVTNLNAETTKKSKKDESRDEDGE